MNRRYAKYHCCGKKTSTITLVKFTPNANITLLKHIISIKNSTNNNQLVSNPINTSGSLYTQCFIKDGSTKLTNLTIDIQESAIKNKFYTTKEFIFQDISRLSLAEHKYIKVQSNVETLLYEIIQSPTTSYMETINGTKYYASQDVPFVTIVAGLIKTEENA
jgi:hypothetical protein